MDREQSEDCGETGVREMNTSDYVCKVVQTTFELKVRENFWNIAELLQWATAEYQKVILRNTPQFRSNFSNLNVIIVPQTIKIHTCTWCENMYRFWNDFMEKKKTG